MTTMVKSTKNEIKISFFFLFFGFFWPAYVIWSHRMEDCVSQDRI